ncbi:MAG: hypothetical protein KGK03_01385 [Candidatus Omnitrophica bacterium]|nr:hypothetical protein [Candidatus Omnitrophota bacterium]
MHIRRGQTILEYTVIMIIIIGVLVAMKDYIKRGIQGRWKASADNLGSQYDPQWVSSNIQFAAQTNSTSIVQVTQASLAGVEGQLTARTDATNSLETKTGTSQVGN